MAEPSRSRVETKSVIANSNPTSKSLCKAVLSTSAAVSTPGHCNNSIGLGADALGTTVLTVTKASRTDSSTL